MPWHDVEILSLWEIAHRWHDVDPDKTDPNDLPIEVRDALGEILPGVQSGFFNLYNSAREPIAELSFLDALFGRKSEVGLRMDKIVPRWRAMVHPGQDREKASH